MLGLVIALVCMGATGFMAGKEYDRMIGRVNYNRQLRREEERKAYQADRAARQAASEKAKFDFIYNVKYNAPGR